MRTWQIELSSILSAYQKGFADLETTVSRMKLPRHEIPTAVINQAEYMLRREAAQPKGERYDTTSEAGDSSTR